MVGCGLAAAPVWQAAKKAIQGYCRFSMEGKELPSPLDQTRHQLLPGDDAFVERYKAEKKPEEPVSVCDEPITQIVVRLWIGTFHP